MCCFVVLYGVSWYNEVWGINKLYFTVLNNDGKHVINSDFFVYELEPNTNASE